MPATPMVGFRCPPELREQLERIAADRRESLSDVVRRFCEEGVRRYPLDED